MDYFASAARGTEELLRDELLEFGVRGIKAIRGGVRFHGPDRDGWGVCLHSRLAQRVHQTVAKFKAQTPELLYAGVRQVDWTQFLSPRHTLAVSAFTDSSLFRHSGFVGLKTKDAIVDDIRDRAGERPTIERDDPDVHVFVHIRHEDVTVYLDLAGDPLFKRGYRIEAGVAPLKETLAAAMLRLSGWDRTTPLLDPLCGSGTIAIEAALWAGNIAPGIFRKRFGFERWACFDETGVETMSELRGAARELAGGQMPKITGSDSDAAIITVAQANARRAGLRLAFRTAPLSDLTSDGRRLWVVTNPPYGERLAADTVFLRDLGAAVTRLHGCRVGLLAGAPELLKAIPLKPAAMHDLWNGDIPCRFTLYDVP
jgi:putative N6-adenine-specific DNA methylase